jgi:hypothetical protein
MPRGKLLRARLNPHLLALRVHDGPPHVPLEPVVWKVALELG